MLLFDLLLIAIGGVFITFIAWRVYCTGRARNDNIEHLPVEINENDYEQSRQLTRARMNTPPARSTRASYHHPSTNAFEEHCFQID